jgi:hypothetical protein
VWLASAIACHNPTYAATARCPAISAGEIGDGDTEGDAVARGTEGAEVAAGPGSEV